MSQQLFYLFQNPGSLWPRYRFGIVWLAMLGTVWPRYRFATVCSWPQPADEEFSHDINLQAAGMDAL